MKKNLYFKAIMPMALLLITLTFCSDPLMAQENIMRISDGREATLEALPESPPGAMGFPNRSGELDALPGFRTPPDGYGPVPLYLWTGDKLTRERLGWQLDLLQEGGIQGVTVYYHHTDLRVDTEFNEGFRGPFGRVDPGDPPVFSDEWWELWDWFATESAKRNMGVGFLDYGFCFLHSGYWPDKIRALPGFKNYHGRLKMHKVAELKAGEPFEHTIDLDNIVSIMAYRVINNGIDINEAIDLLDLMKDGTIRWIASTDDQWHIYEFVTTADEAHMLHPHHGKEWINHYFQRFEDNMDDAGRRGMNYFFQDELGSPAQLVGPGTWAEDFPERFMDRKGYDILPYLPALTTDIGAMTAKVRLDYFDVVMDLAEERFYKPIFDWHWQRGLIYGVDNWGRGLNPTAYGDYFRVHRWFTAPGNDAPGRGESFIQTKVSSSIAHLYERPRVWMEAFHSMGWDTRPDELTGQIDRHYLFGATLFDLASLYYTLQGGWWEFAPPCFHFRMPYWPHFKHLMEYTERLSYLLSQGRHVADVAVIYPVSPMQVNNNHSPNVAFEAGTKLFKAGIDFTFMDYQSLARAEVRNGKLYVAGSEYPVLVLADLPAVRYTTLTQALAHFRSGGIVLAVGGLPAASDRVGSDDPEVDKIVKELFGTTASEVLSDQIASPQRSAAGGLGMHVGDAASLASVLADEMVRDFISPSGKGKALHRRVGYRDVYMVMDAPAGEECFFRANGRAELWDAWTGTVSELPIIRQTDEGTVLRIPVAPPRSSLIVFSPGEPKMVSEVPATDGKHSSETIVLDGLWDSELVPTMDNRWGDYRLPATDEIIGAEARELHYIPVKQSGDSWHVAGDGDGSSPLVRTTFGPQMYMLRADDDMDFDDFVRAAENINPAESKVVDLDGARITWQPYEFSWRWGVLDQPGSQGYHGLKGRVDDRFIILNGGGHQIFRTALTVKRDTEAEVIIEGVKPERILIDGRPLSGERILLGSGTHQILIGYRNAPDGQFQRGPHPIDFRARSAVVFICAKESRPVESQPLAMKWYQRPGLLPFDFHAGEPSVGYYRFLAPPGLQGMNFAVFGQANARVDGQPVTLQTSGDRRDDGANEHSITFDKPHSPPVWVEIRVRHNPGYYGGAAFPEHITLGTGKGKINPGDWSGMGVLRHYSGGIRYGRTFDLTAGQAEGRVMLDLGEVIATCELKVNSQPAGVLINSPFTIDISEYIKPGTNRIEVLVYNTLSNHYQTTPSPYKGNPASGLIGPAKIIISRPERQTPEGKKGVILK